MRNFFFFLFLLLCSTLSFSQNPCPVLDSISYAGKWYHKIAIGDQCWLKENMNVGTFIIGTVNQTNNGILEKYCYNDDTTYCDEYGGLYQWNEAMQYQTNAKAQGICPAGWHIPTLYEFNSLSTIVSSSSNALKNIGQGTGIGVGTNTSGFSALLTGYHHYSGLFFDEGLTTDFWSSSSFDASNVYYMFMYSYNNTIYQDYNNKNYGFSVRCSNDLNITPVELNSFTVSVVDNNVNLNWKTATEVNSSLFEVERKISGDEQWQKIASIQASGNSTSPKNYSYTDTKINSGKYNYRLKMVDYNGTFKYSEILNIEIALPAKFELNQNYPNPFNPSTIIKFSVPRATYVSLIIYNSLGRQVAKLISKEMNAGVYTTEWNATGFASGVYYYKLSADNFVEIKKLMLMK
jgi:uncharacterized protein (TIGR02145 family)